MTDHGPDRGGTTAGADDDFNRRMAAQFRRAADLLETQDAAFHRVRAYRRAAATLETLDEPASRIYRHQGLPGLVAVPSIGQALALAIADVVEVGSWRWLERLEGSADPERVLATVAGIGPGLAGRIHEELGIESLEELETAAHDGRLAGLAGFGPKRVRSVREALAGRFGNRNRWPASDAVSTEELLDIDREYRHRAANGQLPTIAPRRFNPGGEPWLPILHTTRGDRHYTALFSNTARAHQLGRTRDWVVVYADAPGHGRWTIVTETSGPATGRRVVRGQEHRETTAHTKPGP